MNLELTDEQRELATVARGLLDRHAPLSLARSELTGGGDPAALWQAIAEGGWYSVGIDEDDPFGLPGLCLLARECGAHVAPHLLIDTAVALRLTADAAPEGAALERLRAGEATVALAMLEADTDWCLDGGEAQLSAEGSSYRLSAQKVGVHHADRADLLLVLADAAGARTAVLVPRHAEGLSIVRQNGVDPSSRSCVVHCEGVVVDRADAIALAPELLEQVLTVGAIASAAEGLGAASRALDDAIRYSLEREQFGRAIGRFQALQHVMADAHVLRETAWSTTLYAAAALEERTADAPDAAMVAKAHASRAAREVVEAAAQVFGGVAFTWEHDLHLFQRRVLACERRFGDSIHYETQLGERLAAAPVVTA